mgnify:CR=1 FL=1
MTQDTKLAGRVPRKALADARRDAREHGTTLTRLISGYLQHVSAQADPLADAPIVRRLSGILSPQVSIEDHRKHLEEKYGR